MRFWNGMSVDELIKFMEIYDVDSTKHNHYKTTSLIMRSPTAEEYKSSKLLRRFIKKLKPTNVKMMKKADVNIWGLGVIKQCTYNCCLYYRSASPSDREDLSFVFGFKIWTNGTFFRAEGHIWLKKKTGLWIDPTPFEDITDETILLVSTDAFLNTEDRKRIESSPYGYHVPGFMSDNSRSLSGCTFTDEVFVDDYYLIDGKHKVDTVRLLYDAKKNSPLPFVSPEISAVNRRKDAKDKEFWSWRQSIVRQFK